MRKDLLPLVNNPKAAANIDELELRITEWNINCRLMLENGGTLPDESTKRAAFIEMLPPEVNAYVTMRMEEPDFDTYA